MRKEPESSLTTQGDREYVPFMEELRRYQSAGVEITLRDARLPLEDIVEICTVREKGVYMCDFVADEKNRIIRINLDEIAEPVNESVREAVRAGAEDSEE